MSPPAVSVPVLICTSVEIENCVNFKNLVGFLHRFMSQGASHVDRGSSWSCTGWEVFIGRSLQEPTEWIVSGMVTLLWGLVGAYQED